VLRVEASVTRLSSVEPPAGGSPGRLLEASQDREGGAARQHHSSHDHAAVAARTGEGVYREDSSEEVCLVVDGLERHEEAGVLSVDLELRPARACCRDACPRHHRRGEPLGQERRVGP
jgi:hypothetical protein